MLGISDSDERSAARKSRGRRFEKQENIVTRRKTFPSAIPVPGLRRQIKGVSVAVMTGRVPQGEFIERLVSSFSTASDTARQIFASFRTAFIVPLVEPRLYAAYLAHARPRAAPRALRIRSEGFRFRKPTARAIHQEDGSFPRPPRQSRSNVIRVVVIHRNAPGSRILVCMCVYACVRVNGSQSGRSV